jgi:hypothetical protein
MSSLIPKNDYFKHSTRSLLTEYEKQQTIDAIERAIEYLNRMSSVDGFNFTPLKNRGSVWQRWHATMDYLSRAICLIKGSHWPRHVCRRSRRFQVEIEARKIAQETGAEYVTVRDSFLQLMDKYISDWP